VSPVNEFSDESIGSGNRSVTFRLVFQHPSKTLEDSDVNPLIKGIIDVVSKIFDGKLRS
jgi:phenylalanyl-tRNA synthetase beta subunit